MNAEPSWLVSSRFSRRLVAGVALLVIANSALLAYLWLNRGGGNEREREGTARTDVFEFIASGVGMTPEQRESYADLRDDHRRRIVPLQDELRRRRRELFEGFAELDANDSQAVGMTRRIGETQARIDLITVRHFQAVRKLLTTTQQRKFDEIIGEATRMLVPPPHTPPGR